MNKKKTIEKLTQQLEEARSHAKAWRRLAYHSEKRYEALIDLYEKETNNTAPIFSEKTL